MQARFIKLFATKFSLGVAARLIRESLLQSYRHFADLTGELVSVEVTEEVVEEEEEQQQLLQPTHSRQTSGKRVSKRSQWREKQYYCPKCHRGFTLKSNLKRHYNYECGFKPRYKCPYCELRSKQTSQVYSHIRNKHPGKTVYVVNVEKLEEDEQ